MSVADSSPTLIRIEARDADLAASIVQTLLEAFRWRCVTRQRRFEVEFRPRDDSDLTVVQTLTVLEDGSRPRTRPASPPRLRPLLPHPRARPGERGAKERHRRDEAQAARRAGARPGGAEEQRHPDQAVPQERGRRAGETLVQTLTIEAVTP